MVKLLLARFLAAHGLIHTAYLSPIPPAAGGRPWPSVSAKSWLVAPAGQGAATVRVVVTALASLTAVGFALLLGLFHPFLVLGFVIGSLLALTAVASILLGIAGLSGLIVPGGWRMPLLAVVSFTAALLFLLYLGPLAILPLIVEAVVLYGTLGAKWTAATAAGA